ncbi:hypothetical protein QF035_007315 [Streptomyces umbrinus]|uniref:Cold shock domain-containing protein n=1 Tax=Streptomyces umbrinus TaxID=67370 RepID=A0ABU0T1P9_9ACTN|nr:hypothetical protein [Streptomyces umbrinus]MDQ1029733.1 hypothetical protein [Streptomyces umbrinus]
MSGGGPRQGTIVDRRPSGGGPSGALGSYIIRDDEDKRYYGFDYRQIVTEGFRTVRTGERVRFHVSAESPDRAEFVIRLDQPEAAEYYG